MYRVRMDMYIGAHESDRAREWFFLGEMSEKEHMNCLVARA